MKYAVIDVGSNTIRLCVYRVEAAEFHLLFSEKAMAGLAGYVQEGALGPAGIQRACEVLLRFRDLLANFSIDRTFVFATASLRNVTNTEAALQQIAGTTGYEIDLISGQEEGFLDFAGCLRDVDLTAGVLLDIGGGSTEVVAFEDGQAVLSQSLPIGSLSLYTKYVQKILAKPGEQEAIQKRVRQEWQALEQGPAAKSFSARSICGVGGTARAALKLVNAFYGLPADNREFSAGQLSTLREMLCARGNEARTLILRHCPDRVHTILPGFLILDTLIEKIGGKQVIVSRCGVREGYLYQQLERLQANQ